LHAIIVQQYYLVVSLCKLTLWVMSIHLMATSFAFFNLANTVAWGSAQACHPQKKNYSQLPWCHGWVEKWEWEWEGIGNEVIEMGGNWDKKICSRTSLV